MDWRKWLGHGNRSPRHILRWVSGMEPYHTSVYSRPQCVCVGPEADEVAVFVVVILVAELVMVAGFDVAGFEVAVVSVLAFDEVVVPEPPPLKVEPMSPQRMLLNTTCVVGLFWIMSAGLPSLVLQGPLLPVSSQFM